MKEKWYKNWFIHNTISHPLSEIVYQITKFFDETVAEKWSGKVHDITIPKDHKNGRG